MEPNDLRVWLRDLLARTPNLTVKAIAKATNLSSHTVCRFLAEQYVHPSTVAVLKIYYAEHAKSHATAS